MISTEERDLREALRRAARPVQCKAAFGITRTRTSRTIVHHADLVDAACGGGRIRYFARWLCGGISHDVTLIADPAPFRMCKRCESFAQGPFVYRCYDASGRVLYIGHGTSRHNRLQDHRGSAAWWREVARVDVTDQPDLETARRAEVLAIKAERPLHNKQHNKLRRSWLEQAVA